MSPIRVLIADMAVLDRDIVVRIAGGRPDMMIVASADGPAEVAGVLTSPGADVLLLSASEPGPLCPYLALMWTHPRLGVVVVDPTDFRGPLRVLRFAERRGVAGLDWPGDLTQAIRSAAGKPPLFDDQ